MLRTTQQRPAVTLDAVLLRWDELSGHFGTAFDIVMCIWLNEGSATYAQRLYNEHIGGYSAQQTAARSHAATPQTTIFGRSQRASR